jgi:hypothetical protein
VSGNAQLAQTGVPTLVVGGVAYPVGGWMAVAAVLVLAVGLVCLRFRFRPGLSAGQAQTRDGKNTVRDENTSRRQA